MCVFVLCLWDMHAFFSVLFSYILIWLWICYLDKWTFGYVSIAVIVKRSIRAPFVEFDADCNMFSAIGSYAGINLCDTLTRFWFDLSNRNRLKLVVLNSHAKMFVYFVRKSLIYVCISWCNLCDTVLIWFTDVRKNLYMVDTISYIVVALSTHTNYLVHNR